MSECLKGGEYRVYSPQEQNLVRLFKRVDRKPSAGGMEAWAHPACWNCGSQFFTVSEIPE